MPDLKSAPSSSSEKKFPFSITNVGTKLMQTASGLISRNPAASITIIAAVIIGSIFTGGALVATPAGLAIVANIALAASLLFTTVCAIKYMNVSNPYEGAGLGLKEDLIAGKVSDGRSERRKYALLGAIGLIGALATIEIPVGVILCGITAAVVGGRLIAKLASWLPSSKKKEDTAVNKETTSDSQKNPASAVERNSSPFAIEVRHHSELFRAKSQAALTLEQDLSLAASPR